MISRVGRKKIKIILSGSLLFSFLLFETGLAAVVGGSGTSVSVTNAAGAAGNTVIAAQATRAILQAQSVTSTTTNPLVINGVNNGVLAIEAANVNFNGSVSGNGLGKTAVIVPGGIMTGSNYTATGINLSVLAVKGIPNISTNAAFLAGQTLQVPGGTIQSLSGLSMLLPPGVSVAGTQQSGQVVLSAPANVATVTSGNFSYNSTTGTATQAPPSAATALSHAYSALPPIPATFNLSFYKPSTSGTSIPGVSFNGSSAFQMPANFQFAASSKTSGTFFGPAGMTPPAGMNMNNFVPPPGATVTRNSAGQITGGSYNGMTYKVNTDASGKIIGGSSVNNKTGATQTFNAGQMPSQLKGNSESSNVAAPSNNAPAPSNASASPSGAKQSAQEAVNESSQAPASAAPAAPASSNTDQSNDKEKK